MLVALTLPAELVMLKAVTQDSRTASAQWADNLSEASLDLASQRIQDYPFRYRQDIMQRLTADKRAAVWQNHIATYRDTHQELSPEQVDALNAAINVAGGVLRNPGTNSQATQVIAERVKQLFGDEVADSLLHRLGSRGTLMLASAAPWHLQLADFVRDRFVAQAADAGDCWCNVAFGCDTMSMTWCDGAVNCVVDDDWPACG